MTFDDMMVVERHVADIVSGTGRRLPVMLSKEYDRIDIDTQPAALPEGRVAELVDDLAQALGREGYLWDVWRIGPGGTTIHVSKRETEE